MKSNRTGYGVLDLMNGIYELIILNFCWLISSMPLLTIGASTTAMYSVMGQKIRGENRGTVGPFFRAMRDNLKIASIFWIPQVLLTILLGYEIYVLNCNDNSGRWAVILRYCCIFCIALLNTIGSFLYPQIARYYNTLHGYFRNALLLVLTKFAWLVLNIVVLLSPVWLYWLFPSLFWRLGFLWLTIGSSTLFYLSAQIMRRALRPLEPDDKTM